MKIEWVECLKCCKVVREKYQELDFEQNPWWKFWKKRYRKVYFCMPCWNSLPTSMQIVIKES